MKPLAEREQTRADRDWGDCFPAVGEADPEELEQPEEWCFSVVTGIELGADGLLPPPFHPQNTSPGEWAKKIERLIGY